jgi:anti-anti-sigma factor
MEIEQERSNGVLVVTPSGRIDSTTSDALDQVLTRAIEAGERRLVVDFGRVSYISSAGLRVLLVAAKRLRAERGALVLCALGEPVRQVFDLAGFLPLFTVERSRDLALARCAGG